jgi:hypothetical protein
VPAALLEIDGNVVLLMPLGVLLPVLSGRIVRADTHGRADSVQLPLGKLQRDSGCDASPGYVPRAASLRTGNAGFGEAWECRGPSSVDHDMQGDGG